MNLKDYVTVKDNGEIVIDEEAYNKALETELDRARTQASTTARGNAEKDLRKSIEKEIRSQLEEEAKLSAEEKLTKERETLLAERKAFNVERIKHTYQKDNLFSDDEIETLLPLISENFDESLATANKLVEARIKRNSEYEKALTEKYQTGTPKIGGEGSGAKVEGIGAKYAKQFSESLATQKIEFNKK